MIGVNYQASDYARIHAAYPDRPMVSTEDTFQIMTRGEYVTGPARPDTCPRWNWPGKEGRPIKVMALANCDTVELSLNGKSLGEKAVDKFQMVSWEVPYAPGNLEAIGKTN